MSLVADFYRDLLIKQYWDKTNARAEVELIGSDAAKFVDALAEFRREFDLDQATGDRLDKIGEIVGISRIVPFGTPKVLFGFDGDDSARGFADLFDPTVESAPLADLFEGDRQDTELNDNEYREFIRLKIAKNNARAVMVGSSESVSLQDVVNQALAGEAVIYDNQNMSLSLQLSPTADFALLDLIVKADLLPSPQAVGYSPIYAGADGFFGFDGDPTAQGFSDTADPSSGGQFVELYGEGFDPALYFREGYMRLEGGGYLLTESGEPLQFEAY